MLLTQLVVVLIARPLANASWPWLRTPDLKKHNFKALSNLRSKVCILKFVIIFEQLEGVLLQKCIKKQEIYHDDEAGGGGELKVD